MTGLGPVGLSVALLASSLGCQVVGVDFTKERCVRAESLGIVTRTVCTRGMEEDAICQELTSLKMEFQVAIDCSGAEQARKIALKGSYAVSALLCSFAQYLVDLK